MQQGGGIGYDFSTIRPKGADVKGVAADASGPLSLHGRLGRDVPHDHVGRLAPRRDDGDDALRPPRHRGLHRRQVRRRAAAQLQRRVLVTDAFMEAVKADGPWDLVFDGKVYRTLQARDLWNRIMRATYDYAEPGVIFIDRINAMNNLAYCRDHRRDQPLRRAAPAALRRLPARLDQPRAAGARPVRARARRWTRRRWTTWCATAVRMMDNVVDASRFPLPQQAEEARNKRRIGLGVTGLADALLMVGAALRLGGGGGADRALAARASPARPTSPRSTLRRRRAPFPLFDAESLPRLRHDAARWTRTCATRSASTASATRF